jgi:capsular polysaccharide biosynthesis protein
LAGGCFINAKNTDLDFQLALMNKVVINPKSGIMKIKSGHLYCPYKSDREFLSGNYFDELAQMPKKIQRRSQGRLFSECKESHYILPKVQYYYHFLIEELPKLFFALENHPNLQIISAENQPDFVKDFLHDLKVPVVLSNANHYCTNLILTLGENYLLNEYRKEYTLKSLDDLYGEEFFAVRSGTNKTQFFVSRKNFQHYSEKLESSIISKIRVAKKVDVELLTPSEMRFSQQIRVFRSATLIAGIHGSGLANALFMPPGGTLIDYHITSHQPHFYKQIAQLCGLKYENEFLSEIS